MVTIVIPTIGGTNKAYLNHCLCSIFHYTKNVPFRVVLVNNGTGRLDIPKEWTDRITVIEVKQNLGFIRGTNRGLKEVKPNEHVLLMNDDCVVTNQQWLHHMVQHLYKDTVGAVGPVGTNILGPQNINVADYREYVERPYLVGFCMLISADAFNRVGNLDEQFGIGMQDDLDYCIRLTAAGFKMILDRRVFVYHYGSVTFRTLYPDLRALAEVETLSRALLVKKWGEKVVAELFV